MIRRHVQDKAPAASRWALLASALLAAAAMLLAGSASAKAATGWSITALADSSVPPGGLVQFTAYVANEADMDGTEVTLRAQLAPGLSGVSADTQNASGFSCEDPAGKTTIECHGFPSSTEKGNGYSIRLTASVSTGACGALTSSFEIEGGGIAPDSTVRPVSVNCTAEFGFSAFDFSLPDASGQPFTQASGHPYAALTDLDFNTHTNPSPVIGPNDPVEDVKDVVVDLPAGFLGNPSDFGQCTLVELVNGDFLPQPLCPKSSQVGVAVVRTGELRLSPASLFNMVPPPGVPARFAFNVKATVVLLDAELRSEGDYGLRISAINAAQALQVTSNSVSFWGIPFDPAHDEERGCPGERYPAEKGPSCAAEAEPAPFLRMPTSCTAASKGLPISAITDSWQDPGDFKSTSTQTHQAPGYPYPKEAWGAPVGVDGCDQVPFEPSFSVAPSTNQADSPSGLTVDIGLPSDCWDAKPTAAEAEDSICQSDLKEAQVTLPEGMVVNPSAANGRDACSPAQAGLITGVGASPVHFNEAPVSCPDASKVGVVEITTPLLDEPLKGAVYLAKQSENPFGSLLAMYLVAEGSGVVIKQAGEISADPSTGRLTTTFSEVPQAPFSRLHVELFGGSRAALRTPPTCGTYPASAKLTPWSGNPAANLGSAVSLSGCGAGGFDPKLSAGTENPLAGATSPFELRLTRPDGTQELSKLQVKLPPGLSGYLAGIPYCPDSALASLPREADGEPTLGTGVGETNAPSCPAASRIGAVTVGAGVGADAFYTSSGRAYLAGPYKGAPLSIAVVVPAVAGPFDLGTVLVRNAVRVDQASAQLTVDSDPLPTIVHGIPLDLRDVRVAIDRDHFTLNPTNCDPLSVDATLTSTQGATATRSNHFQAANCERLGFKPKLSFALKGAVHRRAHPSLVATLRARAGDANIARAQVKLPPAAFLDNDHIKGICTRVQFAAHSCPANSIYGKAEASSPILGYPLAGAVYLRSSSHKLPDLVADLRGPDTQPIEIALAGKTDSVKGALRNTFELVPDAPVTKFKLTLFGRKRGLIEMSSGFCANPKATVKLDGQNGKVRDFKPVVRADCGKGKRTAHNHNFNKRSPR